MTKHKNHRRTLLSAIFSAVTAITLAPSHALSAEWKIMPSLDLKETYSDNIALAPQGREKGDFVTQINPAISLTGTGPRLKVNARYGMQNLVYADEGNRNTTRHNLNAHANAELLDDFFFLDGRAAISQQNISAYGAQSADNANVTDNLTETTTYSLSPYLRHRFGSLASSELRYTHDSVDTGTGGLSTSESDRILFSLNSGTAFKTLGWGVNYNKQKIDYSTNTIDLETLTGSLRYVVSPRLSLTASSGYEKNNYLSIGSAPEGSFWSAGFIWAPAERTSITASTGKRFYGSTYALSAHHRTRRTAWSLGYSEDITTTRDQFLVPATIDTADFLNQLWASSIPDPVLRQQIVDAFISDAKLPASLSDSINYFTNRVFLQKRLQASAAVNGVKNTIVLSMYNTLREAQTAQEMDSALLGTSNLALNDETRQTGANVLWNWRMTPRTSTNMSVGYAKTSSLSTNREENTKSIRFGLTRKIQPKLNGSLDYRHIQRDSNLSTGDYRENAITASMHMSF
ncbi:MAG: TIGR03016 family PEP-CTERM system-associated outer membrane protein [Sulfuricella sp.]